MSMVGEIGSKPVDPVASRQRRLYTGSTMPAVGSARSAPITWLRTKSLRRSGGRPAVVRQIAAIDRNCRLIKGQVFLWKDGQSREDLWDMSRDITPP